MGVTMEPEARLSLADELGMGAAVVFVVAEDVENWFVGDVLDGPGEAAISHRNIPHQDDNVSISGGDLEGLKLQMEIAENVELHQK